MKKDLLLKGNNILHLVDDFVSLIEQWFIYLALIVMVFLSFFQVVARNLFHFGFVWADDLLRHLVLWAGFVGASLATKDNKHINVDVITRNLPKTPKRYVEAFILLISAIACFIFLNASIELIKMEMDFPDKISSLGIYIWIAELIFPVTFTLMGLRFLFKSMGLLLIPEIEEKHFDIEESHIPEFGKDEEVEK